MPGDKYFLDEEEKICNEIKEKDISTYDKLKLYLNVKDYKDIELTEDEKKLIEKAKKAYESELDEVNGQVFENEETDDEYSIKNLSDVQYDVGRSLKYLSEGRPLTQENVKNALSIYKQGKEEYDKVPFGRWLISFISPFKNEVREMRNSLNKSLEFLKNKGLNKYQIDSYIKTGDLRVSDFDEYSSLDSYNTSKKYIKDANILIENDLQKGENAPTISDKDARRFERSSIETVKDNGTIYNKEELEFFKLIQKLNSNFFGKGESEELMTQEEFNNELNNHGIHVETEALEEGLDKDENQIENEELENGLQDSGINDNEEKEEDLNDSMEIVDGENVDFGNDAFLEEDINFIDDMEEDLSKLGINANEEMLNKNNPSDDELSL